MIWLWIAGFKLFYWSIKVPYLPTCFPYPIGKECNESDTWYCKRRHSLEKKQGMHGKQSEATGQYFSWRWCSFPKQDELYFFSKMYVPPPTTWSLSQPKFQTKRQNLFYGWANWHTYLPPNSPLSVEMRMAKCIYIHYKAKEKLSSNPGNIILIS